MEAAAVAGLGLAVLLVPLGLPGLWVQVAVMLAAAVAGWIVWPTWTAVAALALAAEVAELAVLRRMGERYGASRKAFWAAVAGGFVGLFVGVPVPVVGPVITAFLGTFAAAGLVTWLETRSFGSASRVGWGVLLARTVSVGLKVAVAVAVFAIGTTAIVLV